MSSAASYLIQQGSGRIAFAEGGYLLIAAATSDTVSPAILDRKLPRKKLKSMWEG